MTAEQNMDPALAELKTARENSGMTLKELFERTRISVANLEAIESGNFHLLPVPLYARNFIKTYAGTLGVDSKPLLQLYENYIQTVQSKEKALAEEPRHAPITEALNQHKVLLWIGCIIIVFIAVSFFISISHKPSTDVPQKMPAQEQTVAVQPPTPGTLPAANLTAGNDQTKPDKAGTLSQTGSLEQQPAPKITEAKSPVIATAAAPPKNDFKNAMPADANEEQSLLVIQATEETWIRIQGDDKEPVQVLLKSGEKISHKAGRFSMDIGNAGGIRIQFNGKNIENLGKSGQVIHLRLP